MVQGNINRGRHTNNPAGHHSNWTNQCPPPPSTTFYRPDALPATQPTVSKHWRLTLNSSLTKMSANCTQVEMHFLFRSKLSDSQLQQNNSDLVLRHDMVQSRSFCSHNAHNTLCHWSVQHLCSSVSCHIVSNVIDSSTWRQTLIVLHVTNKVAANTARLVLWRKSIMNQDNK